jgi:hypothetical protein
MSSKWQKSQISLQKKPSCKIPTNLTVDGYTVQAQAFECFNNPHTSCCVPQLGHLQPKEFSPWARSLFEPESPVHIRTWTWNAGNSNLTNEYYYQSTLDIASNCCKVHLQCKYVLFCYSASYSDLTSTTEHVTRTYYSHSCWTEVQISWCGLGFGSNPHCHPFN